MRDEYRVLVRWRRDDYEGGEVTWGELRAQRPDITEDECPKILHAGFNYEHEDGTVVEFTNEQRREARQEWLWAEAQEEALAERKRKQAVIDLEIEEHPCGCCAMPVGSARIWFACVEHGSGSGVG